MADVRVLIRGKVKYLSEKLTQDASFMKENGVVLAPEAPEVEAPEAPEQVNIPSDHQENDTVLAPEKKVAKRKRTSNNNKK